MLLQFLDGGAGQVPHDAVILSHGCNLDELVLRDKVIEARVFQHVEPMLNFAEAAGAHADGWHNFLLQALIEHNIAQEPAAVQPERDVELDVIGLDVLDNALHVGELQLVLPVLRLDYGVLVDIHDGHFDVRVLVRDNQAEVSLSPGKIYDMRHFFLALRFSFLDDPVQKKQQIVDLLSLSLPVLHSLYNSFPVLVLHGNVRRPAHHFWYRVLGHGRPVNALVIFVDEFLLEHLVLKQDDLVVEIDVLQNVVVPAPILAQHRPELVLIEQQIIEVVSFHHNLAKLRCDSEPSAKLLDRDLAVNDLLEQQNDASPPDIKFQAEVDL